MALEQSPPYSQSTQDRLSLYRLKDKLVVQEALGCLLSNAPSLIRLIESQFLHPLIDLPDGLLIASMGDQDPANIDLKNPNISFRLYRPEDILTDNKLFTFSEYLRDLTFCPHFYPQVTQKHPVFPALISQTGVLRKGETPIKVLTINHRVSKEPIIGCVSVYHELSEVPDARFAFRPVIRDGEPTFLIWNNDQGFIRPSAEDSNLITFASAGSDLLEISSGGGLLCIPKINLQVLVPPE